MKSISISVLGYKVTFHCETNSILATLTALYGSLMLSDGIESGIVLNLLAANQSKKKLDFPPKYIIEGNRLRGYSGSSELMVDRDSMSGHAYVCDLMIKNEYAFRHQIINAMTYFLLSSKYLTAIHCSGFIIKSTAFLCLGKSGAGKSTITMGAFHRGLPILTEDICFISCLPDYKLVSDCREIHLLPDSVKFFPELASISPSVTHNGKTKFIDKKKCFLDLYQPEETGFDLQSLSRLKSISWLESQPSFQAKVGSEIDSFYEELVRCA